MSDSLNSIQCPLPRCPFRRCDIHNVHGAVAILPRPVRVTLRMIYLKLLRAFLEVGLLSQRKTCTGVVGSVMAVKINVPRGALTVVEELVPESRQGTLNTSCSVICFDLDSVLVCNFHSRLLKERQLLTCNSAQAHYCH